VPTKPAPASTETAPAPVRGSGITTKDLVAKLRSLSQESFAKALTDAGIVGGTKLKDANVDLAKGSFAQGMSTMLNHLVGMGVVVIHETAETVG
jgi:hypothetical protein